jgi:hypothetical protein
MPAASEAVVWVWWLHYLNFLLLAFNMLLPMYPMDAGRTMQNLLWSRLGYRRAQEIAVNTGFVVAIGVGLLGLYMETLLLGIAIFAGVTCWMERQRLRFEGDTYESGNYSDAGYTRALRDQQQEQRGPTKAERKRRRRAVEEQEELDRLLAKIARDGMGGLTRKERAFLQRTSAERRKSG